MIPELCPCKLHSPSVTVNILLSVIPPCSSSLIDSSRAAGLYVSTVHPQPWLILSRLTDKEGGIPVDSLGLGHFWVAELSMVTFKRFFGVECFSRKLSSAFLLPVICPLLVWRSVPLSLLLTDLLWECFINHPWMILLWRSDFIAYNKVVIGFWSEQCEMRLLSLGVLGVTVLGLCVSLCVYVTCRRNVSRKVFCYHVYSHTWWQRCGLCPVLSWNLGCSSVLHYFLSVMVSLVNLMELRINIET